MRSSVRTSIGLSKYQYHLKDHLGNVRTTFTTKASTDVSTATLEVANITSEQSKFLRYDNAKRVFATIFDHTNGTTPGYSARLNGSTNEKFGLAKSLSAMPGDTLRLEVYGKYLDPNTANWTAGLTSLANQIAAGTGGTVVDGAGYLSSTSSFPFAGLLSTTGSPKAYLNWLVFDRNYIFIPGKSGYQRMTTSAKEAGTDVAHERLASPDIIIGEPGYVYVYLSNEETTPVEVYFDDFKVTQIKSPVIQTDDYYPFGGEFNSYQRENALNNKFKFSSRELQGDLGLNLYDYGARFYDPWGRPGFISIDPHTENYYSTSPYAYALNNPVLLSDKDGRDIVISSLNADQQKALAQFAGTSTGRAFLSQFAVQGKEYNIGGEKFKFDVGQSSNHDIVYQSGDLQRKQAETKTYVYNPVTKKYVDVYGISSRNAGAAFKGNPKYKFEVTLDNGVNADRTLYNIGHESFVHADQNLNELNQASEDYKSGKDANEAGNSPLKGITAENVLSSVLTKVANGPSDHNLLVDGKVAKLGDFVKALDKILKTTKFSDQYSKDKKDHKENPSN